MSIDWLAIRGRPEPPSMPRRVTVGPWSFDVIGAELRGVRREGIEVVRRIYVAVRDPDWETATSEIIDATVEESSTTRFLQSSRSRHARGDIDIVCSGTIDVTPDELLVHFGAEAERAFDYRRLGFCVLHPVAGYGGAVISGTGPGGAFRTAFPERIAPQALEDGVCVPLVGPLTEMTLAGRGLSVHFRFDGDLFETEDQRNWTDASLKTYCTPLAFGGPHRIEPGDRVAQSVRVTANVSSRADTDVDGTTARVQLGADTGTRMPSIGLRVPAADDGPDPNVIAALRRLALGHLRVEVAVQDPKAGSQLAAAASIGVPLELVLNVPADWVDETPPGVLRTFVDSIATIDVCRVLLFVDGAMSETSVETTPASLVRVARQAFREADLLVPIGGGSDLNFAELNRTRPDAAWFDIVAYPIVATVHADDDRSVMETTSIHGETVRSLRAFVPDRPVAVGPITLRWRSNPTAVRPIGSPAAVDRTPEPRQHSRFAAAWLAASVASLAPSGVESLTYFDTHGPRGIGAAGSRVVELLSSMTGRRVMAVHHGAADRLAAFGVADDDGTVIVIANCQPAELRLELAAAPSTVWTLGGAESQPHTLGREHRGSERLLSLEPYDVVVAQYR